MSLAFSLAKNTAYYISAGENCTTKKRLKVLVRIGRAGFWKVKFLSCNAEVFGMQQRILAAFRTDSGNIPNASAGAVRQLAANLSATMQFSRRCLIELLSRRGKDCLRDTRWAVQ